MSASREKKLRQDQTASGMTDPKAEKELEEQKAEKRSNVLYSVIGVLFVVAWWQPDLEIQCHLPQRHGRDH